jgi:quinol monooxygenase YgiN
MKGVTMYAQLTRIRVPLDKMDEVRHIIEQDYLPVVRTRPGFVAAYLLEEIDDNDSAQMIQFWDSHSAAENFVRTGLLASSIQSLAARIPGIQIQRQGYIVRVALANTHSPVPEAEPAIAGRR